MQPRLPSSYYYYSCCHCCLSAASATATATGLLRSYGLAGAFYKFLNLWLIFMHFHRMRSETARENKRKENEQRSKGRWRENARKVCGLSRFSVSVCNPSPQDLLLLLQLLSLVYPRAFLMRFNAIINHWESICIVNTSWQPKRTQRTRLACMRVDH